MVDLTFSLLHATFRAGERAVTVRDTWLSRAAHPTRVEHIFAADADDHVSMACPEIAAGVVSPPMVGVSAVRNWNAAAARATGSILVVIADDLTPCDRWDVALANVIKNLDPLTTPFAVKVGDAEGPSDFRIRHPVISRRYLERYGLWHSGYSGHYVDNDFTLSAHHRGVVLDGRHIRFDHRHPSCGGPSSESHIRMRTDASVELGRLLFERRWPKRKRYVLRRYYRPKAGETHVSELRRTVRALYFRTGYIKAFVPERVKSRVRAAGSSLRMQA